MRVTKTEYSSMTDKASKNSSLLKDCSCAFLVGGAICTIGHSLFLMYRSFGLQEIDSPSRNKLNTDFPWCISHCYWSI